MKTRKEFDSIGSINVPDNKYWGASTQRSNKFFNIGKILVNISIIKSIAIIKRSAAIVHAKDKLIDSRISKAIIKASDEVIKGKLDENFPLKVWQTGSGTQTNMNVNEVISNRAIEMLKGKKGTKKLGQACSKKKFGTLLEQFWNNSLNANVNRVKKKICIAVSPNLSQGALRGSSSTDHTEFLGLSFRISELNLSTFVGLIKVFSTSYP